MTYDLQLLAYDLQLTTTKIAKLGSRQKKKRPGINRSVHISHILVMINTFFS